MKKLLALLVISFFVASCSSDDPIKYENAARDVCLKKGLKEGSQAFEDCRNNEYYLQLKEDKKKMDKAEREVEGQMKELNRARDIHRGTF